MIRIEMNGESYLPDDAATLEELVARIGLAHVRLAGAVRRHEGSPGTGRARERPGREDSTQAMDPESG